MQKHNVINNEIRCPRSKREETISEQVLCNVIMMMMTDNIELKKKAGLIGNPELLKDLHAKKEEIVRLQQGIDELQSMFVTMSQQTMSLDKR